MTTFRQVHEAMLSYNERVAPLSTCTAWIDFMGESAALRDDTPSAMEVEIDEGWGAYWLQVADGASVDYEPMTGERVLKEGSTPS